MIAKNWTKLFTTYRGQWIALKDDETTVVAHGAKADKVLKDAAKKGFANPILFKVPVKDHSYIGLV